MSDGLKTEIIRRAIWCTKNLGQPFTDPKAREMGIFKYGFHVGLVKFHFIWVERDKNLRLGAYISYADGTYPDSVTIVNTRESDGGIVESWHDERLNDVLVERLRRLMLLEDVAGV